MHTFLFGDSQQPLYGVHHAPAASAYQHSAILICNPTGQDYYRTHALLRNLANNLAEEGFHVLRFDYRGTGDSGGELRDVDMRHWLEDIRVAVSELQAISGAYQVTCIGVRIGGYLALQPSLQGLFHQYVLWDGIMDTSSYLRDLIELNQKLLVNASWFKSPRTAQDQLQNELIGFCYSQNYLDSLRNPAQKLVAVDADIRMIHSTDNPQKKIADQLLKTLSRDYTTRQANEGAYWNDIDRLGNVLSGLEIIKSISGEITR